jgi:hypothetical protein
VCVYSVCVILFVDGLIPRPRSPTDCVYDYETEKAAKVHRQSDRRLSGKLMLTFVDRGSHVISVTDPYGRILGFLDQSRYFLFQVAHQLYSRG